MPSNFESHIEGANAYSRDTGANASTDATVTSPAATSFACVYRVIFGYSDDPVTGKLEVYLRNADNSADASTLFSVPITKGGPGPLDVNCKSTTAGRRLRVALLSTGTGVPSLNVVFGEEYAA